MGKQLTKNQIAYYDSLDDVDKRTVALNALEMLWAIGEIGFRDPEPELSEIEQGFYWDATGENLVVPF